jgi:secreted trypsin-like serine protease
VVVLWKRRDRSQRQIVCALGVLVGLLAMTGLVAPAGAITDGALDGNGHPAVVLVLMEVDEAPAFRCSGTLIAPTIVLTAGHCVGEPGEFSGIRIFNEADVESDPTYPGPGGPNTVEAVAWQAHPLFTEPAFFLHDVGLIRLAKPVTLPAGSSFGVLPATNSLDSLKPKASTTFTSVGYGLQQVNSAFSTARRVRMVAHPHLIQINTGFTGPQSMLLSNNAATGGTCFGDSGGPNYLGNSNVVAAVTSFGLNGSCGGTGGVFRVDRPDVLAFINQFMN